MRYSVYFGMLGGMSEYLCSFTTGAEADAFALSACKEHKRQTFAVMEVATYKWQERTIGEAVKG